MPGGELRWSATAAARASAPGSCDAGSGWLSLVFTAGLGALKAACDAGTVDPSVGLTAGSEKNRFQTPADVCG